MRISCFSPTARRRLLTRMKRAFKSANLQRLVLTSGRIDWHNPYDRDVNNLPIRSTIHGLGATGHTRPVAPRNRERNWEVIPGLFLKSLASYISSRVEGMPASFGPTGAGNRRAAQNGGAVESCHHVPVGALPEKNAESGRSRDVAWRSSPQTGQAFEFG